MFLHETHIFHTILYTELGKVSMELCDFIDMFSCGCSVRVID